MALNDFSHLQPPDHTVLQVASLGAILGSFVHVLPELAAMPAAFYYGMLAWEKWQDRKKGDKNDAAGGR